MNQKFTKSIITLCCVLQAGVSVFAQGATFDTGPQMNRTRIVPTAATLNDGRVVLFGGRESGFVSCTYADIYDPGLNSFTEVSMNNPHDATVVIKLQDGKYFVAGGSMNSGSAPGYNVTEIYDPSDDSFSLSVPMTYSRMIHNGTQLANGKILIVGGWYNDQGAASAEVIDLQAGTSVLTNSLNTPRTGALVLPCDDGNAMVIGGFSSYGTGNYTSVEEYDPETNSFTVFSNEIVDGESNWLMNSYSLNRPSSEYRLTDGRYVLLAFRNNPNLEYALVIFDPSDKSFTRFAATSPLLEGVIAGGIHDYVLDIPNNRVFLLGYVASTALQQVGIIGVDLNTGYVQHPASTYNFPDGEYLYPTLAYMPANGKILLTGISSVDGSYFGATDKTYLLTPDDIVGVVNEESASSLMIFPNPAEDFVQFNFNSPASGTAELRVTDHAGRLIFVQNRSVGTGQQQLPVDLTNLAPGMYQVTLILPNSSAAQQRLVSKLVVK